ncbi:MAG: PD-(D/E)XK motif protein [Myxococcota bacterium]
MTSVRQVFRGLRRPEGAGETYAVAPSPAHSKVLVGLDGSGRPALLVQCRQPDQGRPAPVVMRAVEVRHDVSCIVTLPGADPAARRMSLIRCVSDDPQLADYFIDILESVVGLVPPEPSRMEVAAVVLRICELFAALDEPARRDERALWAELFVIAAANDPRAAAGWWRTDPTETFDFSAGRRRLEVKSYARDPRGHHFSLGQLRPPEGVDALVVSLCVRTAVGGTTVRDLVVRIRALLASPELAFKVDQVVAKSLGNSTVEGMGTAFDEQLALETWRCFRALELPCVRTPVPPAVSDVRMRVAMDIGLGHPRREAGAVFTGFTLVLPAVGR